MFSLYGLKPTFDVSVGDKQNEIDIYFVTKKECRDLRPLEVKRCHIDLPRQDRIGTIFLEVKEKNNGFFPQAIGKRKGVYHLEKAQSIPGAYTLLVNNLDYGTLYISRQITHFDPSFSVCVDR